ncbi:hypothetical protein DF186_25280, partial [Enterococcus hirae]
IFTKSKLNKERNNLSFNIDFLKKDKVIAVAKEYKQIRYEYDKVIQSLKHITSQIKKIEKTLDNKVILYNQYMEELD